MNETLLFAIPAVLFAGFVLLADFDWAKLPKGGSRKL